MEEITNKAVIVGVPAINPVIVYIVSVSGVRIVWVNWKPYTL